MDESIGRRLRRIRRAQKLSQQGIARLLGVNITTYGKWERGQRAIPFLYILKLSHQLELPLPVFAPTRSNYAT